MKFCEYPLQLNQIMTQTLNIVSVEQMVSCGFRVVPDLFCDLNTWTEK